MGKNHYFLYSDPFKLKPYLFISDEIYNCINKRYFAFKYATKKNYFIYSWFFASELSPQYFRISNIYIHAYFNYLKRNKNSFKQEKKLKVEKI